MRETGRREPLRAGKALFAVHYAHLLLLYMA